MRAGNDALHEASAERAACSSFVGKSPYGAFATA